MSALRASVRAAFTPFTVRFEALLFTMYVDVRHLVTTGAGNLIDPVEMALDLPWQRVDGSLATAAEVTAEWLLIKHTPGLADAGARAAAKFCKLHLSQQAVAEHVNQRLAENVKASVKRWPGYADMPAPAQLALESRNWAAGASAAGPKLDAAIARGDLVAAAEEVKLNEVGNAGLIQRNVAQRALLLQAAKVVREGGDYDELIMPWLLPPEVPEHAPEPDHLDEGERQLALAFLASTMASSVNDLIEDGRADRWRRELEG